ncbi:MAG: hypothetical protein JWM57_1707 [Phycisphaerales bacterium]|nr:hypothetical protein [Phycisphaerales bacterium]
MVTPAELLRVLLVPLLVSGLIAGIGRVKMCAWAMPLAAGIGFLFGYAAYTGFLTGHLLAVPSLPPGDGTEWLFWLAIPLTLCGVLDAFSHRSFGWLLGVTAGAVSLVVALPLIKTGAVSWLSALIVAGSFSLVGVVMALLARFVRPALGSWSTGIALACTIGATAVVVMSSNVRVLGVYGIAAAAAMGPAAVFIPRKGRGVTVVTYGLMAGLLTGGHFYADPGVTRLNMSVLSLAPLLLLPAAFLPFRRTQVRGVIGAIMVIIALAAVTAPTAIQAKHAAEDDPYGAN